MINWEVVCCVAVALAAGVGFVIGRFAPRDEPYPEPKKPPRVWTETPHSYRESAAPAGESVEPVPTKKRLFEYSTHDNKYVYLSCPACGAKVVDMPVCDCVEVDSGSDVHFHTTCTNCSLHFAMETRMASEERARQKKAREKDSKKEKAN